MVDQTTPLCREGLAHVVPVMRRINVIHFVGIGGAGMCGIAEVMCNQEYTVTGSDLRESPVVERLRELGVAVAIGHAAENVENADVVVVSSAVKADNPEVVAAQEKRIPVVPRAQIDRKSTRLNSSHVAM